MNYCFDLDGTLVDSEPVAAAVVSEHLARRGVPLGPAACARNFSGHSESRIRLFVRTQLGVELPVAFEDDLRPELLARMHDNVQPMPGAQAFTESLPRTGRVAVVSNSSPARIRAALQTAGLTTLLERASIVGHEPDGPYRPKPAPDLYLAALAQMGVHASTCLAFEDTAAGSQAAAGAGIAVMIVSARSPQCTGPTTFARVQSWSELMGQDSSPLTAAIAAVPPPAPATAGPSHLTGRPDSESTAVQAVAEEVPPRNPVPPPIARRPTGRKTP